MPLVLAIEPDPQQAEVLRLLFREFVPAELMLVDSKDAARTALTGRLPDLLLLNILLSPSDEAELTEHLRTIEGADRLQTLLIPRLADPSRTSADQPRWKRAFRRSRPENRATAGCEPREFARQILSYLEEARAAAEAREWALSNASMSGEQAPEPAAPLAAEEPGDAPAWSTPDDSRLAPDPGGPALEPVPVDAAPPLVPEEPDGAPAWTARDQPEVSAEPVISLFKTSVPPIPVADPALPAEVEVVADELEPWEAGIELDAATDPVVRALLMYEPDAALESEDLAADEPEPIPRASRPELPAEPPVDLAPQPDLRAEVAPALDLFARVEPPLETEGPDAAAWTTRDELEAPAPILRGAEPDAPSAIPDVAGPSWTGAPDEAHAWMARLEPETLEPVRATVPPPDVWAPKPQPPSVPAGEAPIESFAPEWTIEADALRTTAQSSTPPEAPAVMIQSVVLSRRAPVVLPPPSVTAPAELRPAAPDVLERAAHVPVPAAPPSVRDVTPAPSSAPLRPDASAPSPAASARVPEAAGRIESAPTPPVPGRARRPKPPESRLPRAAASAFRSGIAALGKRLARIGPPARQLAGGAGQRLARIGPAAWRSAGRLRDAAVDAGPPARRLIGRARGALPSVPIRRVLALLQPRALAVTGGLILALLQTSSAITTTPPRDWTPGMQFEFGLPGAIAERVGDWVGGLRGRIGPAAPVEPVADRAPAAAPAAAVGELSITTNPTGARVRIGARAYGESPLRIPDLPAGRHTVTIESGAGTVRQPVVIHAGRTTHIAVPIFSGWVSVLAPVRLRLQVAGRTIGTTEDGSISLPPGRYDLAVIDEQLGYRSVHAIEVTPGRMTSLSIALPDGTVMLDAVPWADVWIDGREAGRTPLDAVSVPVGTREILFRHPELGERRAIVSVTLREPARVTVDLRR